MEVVITEKCKKIVGKLARKYVSISKDLEKLIDSLEKEPFQGDKLGKNCYKVRMAISSKGYGKSYGARVITCVKIVNETVFLLTIYDKSERKYISDKELDELLLEAELK